MFLLGEDIGAFGGAFGVTSGLLEEFGEERVLDTPIAEEGFVGAAIGAAWMGERPVVELQFADFVSCPFDMIVTVAAKTHWRSGQEIPLVIRLPTGGGVRGGPFHAGSPEGWFVGQPGLKVVCPATVEDAYGLLRAAIDDPDPVLFFEHKALYRRVKASPPPAGHRTPIGTASRRETRCRRHRRHLRLGRGARRSPRSDRLGADVEVLDLRTVWPLDEAARAASLEKTSRVLVLQEAARSTGAAGLVLSLVARRAFELLDAPPALLAPPDTPVPFAPELEDGYLPSVGLDRRRAGGACLRTEPCADVPRVTAETRRGALPARAAAAAVRGARSHALPPGAHRRLGVRRTRPGGGGRGSGSGARRG